MGESLQATAIRYGTHYGWHVVPLLPNSKRPRIEEWQKNATDDPEKITHWWTLWPESNLGVKLGPDSGIIDIECDSDEAEKRLYEIFGGELPETPTFAAVRGKHRLFKWSPDLPYQGANGFKIEGDLEFRTGAGGKGAQSVFPPSKHPDGADYKWIISPDQCEPAEIPAPIIAKLHALLMDVPGGSPSGKEAKGKEHWKIISKGVKAGERNDTAASWIGKKLHSMKDPYETEGVALAWEEIVYWNERNDPPMPEQELRQTFDSILRRHRQKWSTEQNMNAMERFKERLPEEGRDAPWKLVRVMSNPVKWKLYSPLWVTKGGGYITLSTEQLVSSHAIRVEAARQVCVGLPTSFSGLWDGSPKKGLTGLYQDLMEAVETEEGEPEDHLMYVAAELMWEQIKRAEEGNMIDSRGKPTKLAETNEIVYKFTTLVKDINMELPRDPLQKKELFDVQTYIGAQTKSVRVDGRPMRLKSLDAKAIAKLEALATATRVGVKESS